MNENLEDTVLNDEVEDTVQAGDVTVVSEPTVAVVDKPASTVEVVRVPGRAGRKVDTTGTTALGKARLLYAANPTLGPKALKQLFEVELASFNVTPQVAQTYASLVRKGTKAAA